MKDYKKAEYSLLLDVELKTRALLKWLGFDLPESVNGPAAGLLQDVKDSVANLEKFRESVAEGGG